MVRACDICGQAIGHQEPFHHCEICSNGDYDICQPCSENGSHCFQADHVLVHLVLEDTKLIDLGTVEEYENPWSCPGCAWKTSQEVHHRNEEHCLGLTYEYSRIPSVHIRLIALEPADDDAAVLKYVLHNVLLDPERPPAYEALSYTWGEVSKTVPSICNGKRLEIQQTLDIALRRIRKEVQPRSRIWADGICINQSNNAEKAIQVAKMGRIYQHALRTIVWLGPADASTALSLDVAHKKMRLQQAQFASSNGGESRVDWRPPERIMLEVHELSAILEFINKPWFNRLWVVQEVCLWTKEQPLVFCGLFALSWEHVVNLHAWIYRFGIGIVVPEGVQHLGDGSRFMRTAGPNLMRLCAEFSNARRDPNWHRPSPTLHQCLVQTWGLKSSNPQDKIYGMTALVQERYMLRPAPRDDGVWRPENTQFGKPIVNIDYDVPFETLYEDAARLIIHEEESLALLTRAGSSRSERSSLPSWIPDWSRLPEEPPIYHEYSGEAHFANGSGLYHATNDLKPLVRREAISGLLEAAANFQDRVAYCPTQYFGEGEDQSFELGLVRTPDPTRHLSSLWKCFGSRYKAYPTGELPMNAFWRTTMANRNPLFQGNVPPDSFHECFVIALKDMFMEDHDFTFQCVCPEPAPHLPLEFFGPPHEGPFSERQTRRVLLAQTPSSRPPNDAPLPEGAYLVRYTQYNDFPKEHVYPVNSDISGLPKSDCANSIVAGLSALTIPEPSVPGSPSVNPITGAEMSTAEIVSNPQSGERSSSSTSHVDKPSTSTVPEQTLSTTSTSAKEPSYHTAYPEHYLRAVQNASTYRRFFITQRGYMGIGPKDIKPGDTIALFKGGPLPFVIRKTVSRVQHAEEIEQMKFSLVGEAYVHGISDGEVLEQARRNDIKAEDDDRWFKVFLQ